MSRLPAVGGDTNSWGTVLNDYLQVSLDAGGKLKGADLSVRYVDPSLGSDTNNGYTPQTAKLTIQAAYDSLPNTSGLTRGGGTILLANGRHNCGTGLIFQKTKLVVISAIGSGRTQRSPSYALTGEQNPVLYTTSGAQIIEIKQPTGTVIDGQGFEFHGIAFDLSVGSPDYGIYYENINYAVVDDCSFFGPEPQTKPQWGIRGKTITSHGSDSSWWRILNNNASRCGLVYAGGGTTGNETNQFVVERNVIFPGSQVDACIHLEGGHRIVTFANNCESGSNPAYGIYFENCWGAMAFGDSGEIANGTFLKAVSCNGCLWMPIGSSLSTADTDFLIEDDSGSNLLLTGVLTGSASLYDAPEYKHLTRTGFSQAPVIGPNGMSWPGILAVPTKLHNNLNYFHPEPYDMVPAQTLVYEYWDGAAWTSWTPTDGNNVKYPNTDYLVVDDTHKRWRVKLGGIGNPDLAILMVRAYGAGSYSGTFNVTMEDLSGVDAVQATHGPIAYTMSAPTEGFVFPTPYLTGPRFRLEVDFSFLTAGQSMRVSRIQFLSPNNTRNRDYGGRIMRGAGAPESAVTGRVGDLYLRLDGAAGTTLYVKESGTGNTGWKSCPGGPISGAYTQTYATADKTHANLTSAALTDSSGGTADTTLAAVEAAYTQTTLRNNFADLAAQCNALRNDLIDVKQLVNSVIDDLQSVGLLT